MKLLDLCAGVGGFSYAAHKLGWVTEAFCEKDAFCQKVLAKNFSGVPIYDDVYTFPGESFRGRIDVLTGGFPCQPFSAAGKRLGVRDERHLFPEIVRIIREVQPTWVVLENVNGLVTMAFEVRDVKVGRTKYTRQPDIDDYEAIYAREENMLLNRICEDIEAEGYAVQPIIVPAVALEADHERKRIWIVARRNAPDAIDERRIRRGEQGQSRERAIHPGRGDDRAFGESELDCRDASDASIGRRRKKRSNTGRGGERVRAQRNRSGFADSNVGDAPDAQPYGLQGGGSERHGTRPTGLCDRERPHEAPIRPDRIRRPANWLEAATEFCRVPDGSSVELDQPDGRDNRVDRLKALGNAIYWRCAYQIFMAIDLER